MVRSDHWLGLPGEEFPEPSCPVSAKTVPEGHQRHIGWDVPEKLKYTLNYQHITMLQTCDNISILNNLPHHFIKKCQPLTCKAATITEPAAPLRTTFLLDSCPKLLNYLKNTSWWVHLSRMLYIVQTEEQMLSRFSKPGTPMRVWHLLRTCDRIKEHHLHYAHGIFCPVFAIQSQAKTLSYGTCLYYHAHKTASEAMNTSAKPR